MKMIDTASYCLSTKSNGVPVSLSKQGSLYVLTLSIYFLDTGRLRVVNS
jgi:hypothetical protein